MFATVEEGGGDDDLVMNLFNKLLTFKCGEKGEGVGEGVDEGVARELSYGDLRKWVFPAGTSAGNTVVVPESEIKQVIQQTEEKKEVVLEENEKKAAVKQKMDDKQLKKFLEPDGGCCVLM